MERNEKLPPDFLRNAAFAPFALLLLTLAVGGRASEKTEGDANERGVREGQPVSIVPVRPLKAFLEAGRLRPQRNPPAEGATAPHFGAAAMAPFLTVSRLFPPLLIGQNAAGVPGEPGEIVGQSWTGAVGVSRSVADIMAAQAALDAQGGVMMRAEEDEHEYPVIPPVIPPNAVFSANWPPSPTVLIQKTTMGGPIKAQATPALNFRATGIAAAGYYPPDTDGDVGPTQVIALVNGRIILYNKSGVNPNILNSSTDNFFASVRNGSNAVDTKIRFDRTSQRWFVSAITNASASNRILLAVSDGPNISATTGFKFYQFTFDQPTPTSAADTGGFADYPSLGVDANAVYIGTNIFKGGFQGSSLFVVRKSSVTATPVQPIVVAVFREIGDSGENGIFTPQGATNDDPNAVIGYVVGPNVGSGQQINLRRVLNPGGVPTLSPLYSVTAPVFAYPASAPAQGSPNNLDASDLRLFSAQIHRNALTGAATLWTAHTVSVNGSGVSGGSTSRDGTRWYEIQNLDTTPTLRQAGTLYDPTATNPIYFTYGTVAMSGQGAMALGATATGTASYTKIAVSGRNFFDPLGATQTQSLVSPATAVYNPSNQNPYRWGDYSHTVVDPQDDQTFWTFQEYCDTTNNWAVQVVQVLAPPPPKIVSVSPSALTTGTTLSLVVSANSTAGTAFFDPLPEYARHISVATNAPGVAISSIGIVVPVSPTTRPVTQVKMTVTVDATASPGTYNLTITNPDGQSVTATNALTISVPTPTLSFLNPASADAGGGDFTLTVRGAGFFRGAVVNFNGVARPTGFVNTGQLIAVIPSSDIANVGSYDVTVSTPSGSGSVTTAPLPFAVNTVSVSGTIMLEGLTVSPPPVLPQAVRLDFRTPGTTNVLFTRAATVQASGAFVFGGVTPGKYDLAFKGTKYLRSVLAGVDIAQTSQSGLTVTLSAGDANDDNAVDVLDFGALINAYGSQYDPNNAMSGYDATADFNDDGVVDVLDFGLLVNNYGTTGTP